MILLALLVAGGVVGVAGGDPCAHVVDRTATCAAPAELKSTIPADAKDEAKTPAKIAGLEAEKIPGELAFFGAGFALAGGALLAISFANTPKTDDALHAQQLEQVSAVALLSWAGLVEGSAIALAIFDASTGEFRPKGLYAGAD